MSMNPQAIQGGGLLQAIQAKYYEKQPAGFCQFLASIGAVPSVEACINPMRSYLEAKNAMNKWVLGLQGFGRVLQTGMATPYTR